ncbi:mechanosensitive ion channel family protein MscS [Moraxella macacae 0408225]|uniref:Small-conductance mechanosensitive channel n=1 Tax=Moraxella macacae 0408225 TaxID=1230338 RepID=L2F754_9GAMM|nr:mechanosensitive ion channel domain-containing protein [Moraxella macacae]ELA08914.1 mechanosensitive ion channel family protein MscS [Moraxella macacae 0408225]
MELLGVNFDPSLIIATAITMFGKLIVALLIFFIGKWILNNFVDMAKKIMQSSHLDATLTSFLSNVLYGIGLVIVIMAALNQIGVSTTSVIAILGGMAVAVGVSLKDQLSNLAAGVMIVIFRPFNRGDYIEINGDEGTVQEITLVNTRIYTSNNHEIIIPNSKLTTNALTNFSSLPDRRIDITFNIGYEANIKQAKQVILDITHKNPLVLQKIAPVIAVSNLADSSVDLLLKVWVENKNAIVLKGQLLEDVKEAFDTHGISIPYPHRQIYVRKLDADND